MVQITAVVDVAKANHAPRILRGHAIIVPVGNPDLTPADEKTLRAKYIEKAFELLKSPAEVGVVHNLV